MSKIVTVATASNVTTWEELRRWISSTVDDIVSTINGRLNLVENCQTRLVDVTFPSAGEEVKVPHSLKYIPNGYMLARSSAPLSLYDGKLAATANDIYLRASAPGTARVLIF